MSHIEEALRRARASVVEDVAPPEPDVPVLRAQVHVPPDPVADVVREMMDLPVARAEVPYVDVELEPETLACDADDDDELPLAEPKRSVHVPRPAAAAAPVRRGSRNDKLILNAEIAPGVVEQYRKAAATLHQLQLDRGIKVVMITSALAEDGKTLTASNIALTLSESFRRRVLLIDADLRRPAIHTIFGTPNTTGLNDALKAERDEKLTIFEVTPHLSVLPSGRPNKDPMSNLSSERMRNILEEAATKFDWVLIDTPPVGILADARLLAEMVHAVVLVVGAGRTPFRAIDRAIQALDRKRIAGVVLNRVTEQPAGYHYYDYYATEHRE
jgi:capsular exopolysaccharide synthesis family protein